VICHRAECAPHTGADRGSVTVHTLVLLAVLGVLAVAAGGIALLLVGHRTAASAADLAALAAAQEHARGTTAADGVCAVAARIAAANRAELTACRPDAAGNVVVTVEVAVDGPGGRAWQVEGRSRAGPVP
jgi:secretion/DNA translocation related TadE-like protein